MKRVLSIFLIICTMTVFAACEKTESKDADAISFYYCKQSVSYNESNNVIAAEEYTINMPENDLAGIITEYLSGPQSPELTVLFHSNTALTDIQQNEDTLQITLSADCRNMEKLDLVLACSCLAKTLMPLTDAERIQIDAVDGFANIDSPLVFDADSILTDDVIKQNS